MADQWRVTDLEELEKWHTSRGRSVEYPKRGFVDCGGNDLPEPRGIQVRESFHADTPWYVVFGFGFPRHTDPEEARPESSGTPARE